MRERLFGAMAALAIILNALYAIASVFLSPRGVEYPFLNFGGTAALILALLLYGPALIALSLWLANYFGNHNAQNR